MSRDKFLFNQLIFNDKTNDFITKKPKQSNYLKLKTKIKYLKKSKSK